MQMKERRNDNGSIFYCDMFCKDVTPLFELPRAECAGGHTSSNSASGSEQLQSAERDCGGGDMGGEAGGGRGCSSAEDKG